MSAEILVTTDGRAVLSCNTTDVVFGPIFEDQTEAEEFCEWLKTCEAPADAYRNGRIDASGDPRNFAPQELDRLRLTFLVERDRVAA